MSKGNDKAKKVNSSKSFEGIVTIIIDNYTINYAPTEFYNTTVLIEIIATGQIFQSRKSLKKTFESFV